LLAAGRTDRDPRAPDEFFTPWRPAKVDPFRGFFIDLVAMAFTPGPRFAVRVENATKRAG